MFYSTCSYDGWKKGYETLQDAMKGISERRDCLEGQIKKIQETIEGTVILTEKGIPHICNSRICNCRVRKGLSEFMDALQFEIESLTKRVEGTWEIHTALEKGVGEVYSHEGVLVALLKPGLVPDHGPMCLPMYVNGIVREEISS